MSELEPSFRVTVTLDGDDVGALRADNFQGALEVELGQMAAARLIIGYEVVREAT